MMSDFVARLRKLAGTRLRRRFGPDERGAAIVEFAVVMPVALAVLGLLVGLGEAIEISQKVSLTARTIVDIVSKAPPPANSTVGQISLAQMQTYLAAASYTMTPYDTSSSVFSIVVSEIDVPTPNNASVAWSCASSGGTKLPKGSIPLPANFDPTTTGNFIYGTVNYNFSPLVFGNLLPSGAIQLTDTGVFSPRQATTIADPGC